MPLAVVERVLGAASEGLSRRGALSPRSPPRTSLEEGERLERLRAAPQNKFGGRPQKSPQEGSGPALLKSAKGGGRPGAMLRSTDGK